MMIHPKNWNTFQHYKDRRPPWIKLHHTLLDDVEFLCLPIASRALAPLLWLLASEYQGGEITLTLPKLAFRLRMTVEDLNEALKPLIDSGLFDASEMLAKVEQSARLDRDREETEKEQPPTPLPPASGASPKGEPRKRRAAKHDSLAVDPPSPEAVRFGKLLKSEWRKIQPDGAVINSELTPVITRMDDIAKRQPLFTPEVLYLAGKDYLALERKSYKAAQYFLSLEPDPQTGKPPFHPFCVAVLQAQRKAVQPLEVAHAI